ncbi:MAG: endo alpha-1,4 polygalactosaminidase [Deltaproteobacteria bacterium]|nr:MAG: endo alpha-1,4 polygalactosaminidase [Deltaproteobacteria bacterium]TMB40897.1 MAG: endo alpha-1,4 polygalactosaminidase [Deltaproteobacteria bacterium]
MGLVVRMVLCGALLTACTAQQPQGTGQGDGGSSGGDGGTGSWWQPRPGTSWQWQLSGALDVTVDAGAYDIDLFDNAPAQIAALQGMGRKVVCYFDTAYEPGRPDSSQLDPYKGNPVSGWPGQYWLDIRQPAVVNVMKARVALAQQKGCDAVEADDVDSRTNNPGFPITAADQQGFIRTLAAEAHSRRLSFALKNDLDEIPQLLGDVDFALNEECFQYNECSSLQPFIAANKAVFQVEYTSGDLAAKGATICPQANALNFDTLIKHVELDAPRYSCR